MATVVARPDQPAVPFPPPYTYYTAYTPRITYNYTSNQILATPTPIHTPPTTRWHSPLPSRAPSLHTNFSKYSSNSNLSSTSTLGPLLSPDSAASLKSRIEACLNTMNALNSITPPPHDKPPQSNPKKQNAINGTLFLLTNRFCLLFRILALFSTLASFGLVLYALVAFLSGRAHLPNATYISLKPCIIFSSISAFNIVLSAATLIFTSPKCRFRCPCVAISANFASAVFAVSALAAFGSGMAACVVLVGAKGDLWAFACKGALGGGGGGEGDAFGYRSVCKAVDVGWHLGLVQAVTEVVVLGCSVAELVWGRMRRGRVIRMSK